MNTAPPGAGADSGATGAVVVLHGVARKFGTLAAVHALSAQIFPGRLTGLAGPDGAGKTTLMRMMAGLLTPSSGSIRVDGLDPLADRTQLRERIGYMPQRFGLYEDLTVRENLELHADLRGVLGDERTATFKRLLDFTGLAPFTKRLAGKLSGGMKQKIGLACALLGHPRLLLLDEPGVGVDPISRRDLWQMVQELLSDGLAVVWSTAYLDEAEQCHDVLLLNEGRLIFNGDPATMTARMDQRTLHIRGVHDHRRQLLTRALQRPEVMDGVIQGDQIRLVLRVDAQRPPLPELDAGPDANYVAVAPRFEDAFIDALGGGPGGVSALAEAMPEIPPHQNMVVEAHALSKQFGEFTAVDSVDFAVKQGEIFGLLGPNGAGKSTTFRMLCGLLRPTAGTARVMGIDLTTSASKARQRLGYMAQKFSLYDTLSVRQNLAFFAGIYGLRGKVRNAAVAEMLRVFAMESMQNATPGTLSLGFKQRLALACAVMHRPDILFLDEPTSGVDPVTRREFWTHITGMVEKGVTVVVTTHFMEEAEYCDRIALLHRGRIIAAGTPQELKRLAASIDQANTAQADAAQADISMEDAFIRLIQDQADPVPA